MLTYLNLFMNVLRLFFVWNLDKGCIQKNRINKRKMKKKKKKELGKQKQNVV